jgi:hypothetical protein
MNMAKFEMNGKEYEVKLDFKAVSDINKKYDSALSFVGEVMQGNFDAFIDVIYFGLYHTGEGFTRKQIEKEIQQKFENEELDLDYILVTGNEVVTDNFFFRKTVNKMMKSDPTMKEQMETIYK